ncbi:MAG: hypothetical protein IME93_06410 [Proteobacteria bacterium]|nr:hypothetical protein [Pseudomonadota bacterium]
MGTKAGASLVFIYNADSGLFNTLTDIAHKIFSPETYGCALCEISHGYFHMRGEWKDFIDSLDIPCEFLHRDEALAKYTISDELPAVFLQQESGLKLCLSAKQIQDCSSASELQKAVMGQCCTDSK